MSYISLPIHTEVMQFVLERREDDLHEVSLEGVGVVVGVSYISLPIHTEVMQFVLEREKTTYMRFRRKVSGLL